MSRIVYFASIRETLNCEHETIELPTGITTIEQLIEHLIELHGDVWQKTLKDSSVLVAINQTIAQKSSAIIDTDEVAFFPPVTGG